MDGFIDWATALVDEVLRKSRMTELQPIAAPLDSETKAIERAKRIGTYEQIDRSRQYATPDHAEPAALLKTVNVQSNRVRAIQSANDRMERRMNLTLRNSLIVSVVTALVTAAATVLAARVLH
jgi:hypothetical protein